MALKLFAVLGAALLSVVDGVGVTAAIGDVMENNGKSFQESHDFEKRSGEAARIRAKYPDRIPVICERDARSDIPNIDKKKYLVPQDLTIGQFVYVIRKRIKLSPEKAIFIFINNVLPPTAALMSSIYEQQKNKDGFLYVTYSGENTFGDFLDEFEAVEELEELE